LSPRERLVSVGRVGRPHGRDGSFWVDEPLSGDGEGREPLAVGTDVFVAGRSGRVERLAGAPKRPLVRVSSIADRQAAAALRGTDLLVAEANAPLGVGEWLVEDLVGARIDGLGEVRRVVASPSCDLLEVGEEGVLVPLVSDAVRRVDVAARRIEVDRTFLGLDATEEAGRSAGAGAGPGAGPRAGPGR
jgi:16S rRNA processing protein RimM